MSEQRVGEQVFGGPPPPVESPPAAEYTLMYMGVNEVTKGQGFDGREPEDQLILDFKIDAEEPQPGSAQEDWHHFDFRGYFTPKLHYNPNLPGYTGRRYIEPSLYKLARALNGGTPIEMPTATTEDGRPYFVAYNAFDAAAMLEPFERRRFRCVVGPNERGYARLQGDPMPLIAAGTRGRRGQKTLEEVEAVPVDDPFEQDDAP